MPLNALEIFKLLPKTNCGECDFPTCLAFAMNLAAKKADLSQCPHVSDETKIILGEASAPPMRKIEIGLGENKVIIGEELVLFRHEKSYVHPTCIALKIVDTMEPNEILTRLEKCHSLRIERVGETLEPDLIVLKNKLTSYEKYIDIVKIVNDHSSLPFLLMSENPAAIQKSLEHVAHRKPAVYAATVDNWETMVKVAKQYNIPLICRDPGGLESLENLVIKVKESGIDDIILDPAPPSMSKALEYYTLLRRLAIEKRKLGYPTILNLEETDPMKRGLKTVQAICKYVSILVLEDMEFWESPAVFILRQNIFTDPQKPLQVKGGLYAVGTPEHNSPLLVTTNFSLTYFIVSQEIETSGVSSHILVVEADGMSVLTAWSAGKFSGEVIVKALIDSGVESQISHRILIIPGYIAALSGELEDRLPGWAILVGPQDVADIGSFFKEIWFKQKF